MWEHALLKHHINQQNNVLSLYLKADLFLKSIYIIIRPSLVQLIAYCANMAHIPNEIITKLTWRHVVFQHRKMTHYSDSRRNWGLNKGPTAHICPRDPCVYGGDHGATFEYTWVNCILMRMTLRTFLGLWASCCVRCFLCHNCIFCWSTNKNVLVLFFQFYTEISEKYSKTVVNSRFFSE